MSNKEKRKLEWLEYDTYEKIKVPILYYIDEETNKKVYDFEEMACLFEYRLSQLTGLAVMCSIEED